MPRKKDKKSGEKQDEAKKMSKKGSSSTPADKTGSEDKEKDLYLTQIRYLNEQLERYQLKCDQLETQSKDLNSQYSTLEKEKKDIVEYLKRSLLEKEDEVDALAEQLESQRQAADTDRDALQLQHAQLRQELQDRIEEVDAENTTLVARLAGLEEFQKQKELLMSNMESLEKQLTSQEEQHEAAIHDLEMKALLEKKRLEKEMDSHKAAMSVEVQHLVDQKVPETTRLALQENIEVKARIRRLAGQTHVLMVENSALRDDKSRLGVDVDNLEQMLRKTCRESCVQKKVMEQLTEKCQQLQAEVKDWRKELEQLQTKHTGVLAEVEALRRDRASLSEQCSKNRSEVSQLEAELQEEGRRRSRMKNVMQETAITLRQALMNNSGVNSQWKQLMEKLLVVLDQPRITHSPAEHEQPDEMQTSDPAAAARAVTLNPEVSRYRPGDLGLVPHPTVTHKHGTGAGGSSSTHVPLHRKPSCQKTASSISSAVGLFTSRNSFTKPQ